MRIISAVKDWASAKIRDFTIQYKSDTIDLGDWDVRHDFIINAMWRMVHGRESDGNATFSVLRNVAQKSPLDAFQTTATVLQEASANKAPSAAIYNGMDVLRQLSETVAQSGEILRVVEVLTEVEIEIRAWTSIPACFKDDILKLINDHGCDQPDRAAAIAARYLYGYPQFKELDEPVLELAKLVPQEIFDQEFLPERSLPNWLLAAAP